MAITAEQLNVILSAKDKQFARAMVDNAKRVERFSKRSQKGLNKTTKSFNKMSGAAKGLIAVLSGAALVAGAKKLIDKVKQVTVELDEIGKMADNIGLSTDALQELRTIAESSGMTFQEFTKGFAKFSVSVGEAATGTGEAVQAFKTLGIRLTTASGATKNAEVLFNELSDAIKGFTNDSDKASIMADLFGQKVGIKMLNLLNNGSDGMARMRQEARDLGIVIDEKLIRSAEDAQTKLDLMSRVINANLNSALITLAPQLVTASKKLAEFAKIASDFFENTGFFKDDKLDTGLFEDLLSDLENFPKEMEKIGLRKNFLKIIERDIEKTTDRISELIKKNQNDGSLNLEDQREYGNLLKRRSILLEDLTMYQRGLVRLEEDLLNKKKENTKLDEIATNVTTMVSQKTELIQKLQEEARLKGLTNEERAKETALMEKEIFLKKALSLIDKSDLANKYDLMLSIQELADIHYDLQVAMGKTNKVGEESVHVFKEIETTITSSMENAFMSMVDGTATVQDAFRSMARDIIKELYRVMFVQKMVGSFDSGTGIMGAIGSAFGIPSSVPKKAAGGTVSAGTPHIVGEHGRELFVPQQAGRVMTTAQTQSIMSNGGGGGSVVVNQSINVSTGVAQTVRTEIKSLMPQIAEGTKNAVLDAKRRGGSFGSAFA